VIAPALEARGLARNFGALIATDDVSFAIQPGARQALIGPNGAGKTTLINLLTGVIRPTAGQVLLATVNQGGTNLFSAWPQFAVTVAYTAILLIIGAVLFRKRDA